MLTERNDFVFLGQGYAYNVWVKRRGPRIRGNLLPPATCGGLTAISNTAVAHI